MPDLSELFSQARELHPTVDFENEQQRSAIFEALKKSWGSLYQGLVNMGFGAAQTRFQKDLDAEKTARTKAETDLATLRESVKNKQDPEVKQLNEQWQARLTEETGKLQTALEQAKAKIRDVFFQRDAAVYENLLVERGVPKANARGLAHDPLELPKRSEYDDNGALTVYQAGQKIPLMPATGQTVLHALADEVVARPEVQEILISEGDAGAGITNGRSSGPATGDKAFFETVRKSAKEEQASQLPKTPLRERIKNR